MILVNLRKSWPAVMAGDRDAAEVTLGEWAALSEDDLARHADVVVGVYRNTVVTALEIAGWERDETTGRVTFTGQASDRWAHLLGEPVPGTPWVKGAARPVKVLDSTLVRDRSIPPSADSRGRLTSTLGSVAVTVTLDGHVQVEVQPGTPVTVTSRIA